MQTHFITIEVDLTASIANLHQTILQTLQQQGEPLRWAIASLDVQRQKAIVEAVVTVSAECWVVSG